MSVKQGWIACAAVAAAVLVAPGLRAEDKEPTGDLKTFQGAWVSKDDQGESTWEFKGSDLHLKTPDREYEIVVTLGAEAKPHKTIDFAVKDSSPDAKGYKAPGIYKIDGDTITIAFGAEGERPKDFTANPPMVFVWELKKK